MTDILSKIDYWLKNTTDSHSAGVFPSQVLSEIEDLIGKGHSLTAETGCGKSTIFFSNISSRHIVFALDDTNLKTGSSVNFYRECPITRMNVIEEIFGPSQKTVVNFDHREVVYDVVLLDGAHGWPFPELEYFFFYSRIRLGGFLIIDDVNIPTIGRMADILAEDAMWNLIGLYQATAVFQRTQAEIFDPYGDGWWQQKYNQRRVSNRRDIFLPSSNPIDLISSLKLDEKVHGEVQNISTPGFWSRKFSKNLKLKNY
jgi:hypothetical protein